MGNNETFPVAQGLHYEDQLSSWNCLQELLRSCWSFTSKRLWVTLSFFNPQVFWHFFSESFLKVEWHLSLLAAVITRASSSSFPHERLASTKGLYQSIKESEWVKEKQKLAHFSVKNVNFCFYHLDLLAVTLIIQNPSQMFCSQVFTAFRSCN